MEKHPYPARGELTLTPRVEADAAALWAELLGLERQDPHRLDDRILHLGTLELRILVASARQRLGDASHLRVLSRVIALRKPPGSGALAFAAWLLTDGDAGVREPAARFVAEGSVPVLWTRLVEARKPSEVIVEAYLEQDLPFDAWVERKDIGLSRFPECGRLVRLRLMTPPLLGRVDDREQSAALEKWANTAVPAPDREAWYQTYLESTRSKKQPLRHAVLESILQQFGEPREARAFWKVLSPQAVASFEIWLRDRQLTSLLGEGERVMFWRWFLADMTGCVANSDGSVVFILFPTWFAAQFKFTGTATYMYPKQEFLVRMRRQTESAIRNQVLLYRDHAVGRYTHMAHSWQDQAADEVRRVLRAMQR